MFLDGRLWQFTEGLRWRIAGAVCVGLLAALVGIGRLALLGWLLARVFAGAPAESLILPVALVAAVMGFRGVLEYWRNMIAHRTAARVQLALRERLFDKVVELGPAHFGLERTGDVLLATVDGVEQLETYFGQYLPQLFVAALTPVIVFALVATLDLPVALVMFGFALVTLMVPSVFQKWDSSNSMRRQEAYAAFAAEFLDAIQGFATLKAFGQSAARAKLLAAKAHELFRTTMWVLATNSLSRGIVDAGLAVGAAATLGYGAYRVSSGSMSLEVLLIVLMMGIEVYRPQRDLRALLHQGMVGLSSAKGILAVLGAKPAIIPRDDLVATQKTLAPTVSFEHVSFAYPGGRRQAHQNLSFHVAAGERVGIVGASGSGKSSIVRLLLRFYDPQEGSVRIGGCDLRDLHPRDVHRNIAVVNQDTYLFHGSVEDNLRFGKPDASHEELQAAARAANAHGFIAQLPRGYQTIVGERGIRLSGGQRQRIAIARALLRDAPILVLDEALSAVDAENEVIIQEALDRLMRGRTTLIFAHRLSSVIGADRLLVLEQGRLVESGTHASLMQAGGTYHTLMAAQAAESAGVDTSLALGRPTEDLALAAPSVDEAENAHLEPTDAILRAEGMGWFDAFRELFRHVLPWKGKLLVVFFFGVSRVFALIGVGIVSALVVAAVTNDAPYDHYLVVLAVIAPLAGILHWTESWIAHDMAFRMLAEMRIALFEKLDRLAPAYLLRRRTGDLVAMATHDVELVEFFFAHTVAPALVAVLVPALVFGTLLTFGWPMAMALLPFLIIVALSPFFMRARIDALGSRAREALAELNAHVVDTIQGLNEIIAFEQVAQRKAETVARTNRNLSVRLPFFRDLTIQMALLEVATGLGGLAVVFTGARLVGGGELAAGTLPLLTLLAMAAFLPVSEIAHIGRQLADTLGATRRLYAVHNEQVAVSDGPGAALPGVRSGASLEFSEVDFSYFSNRRLALEDASFFASAGSTVALVGSSGAGKTTAAHLLMRFFDPQKGEVRMNGVSLRDYKLDALRDQIALVTQDTYLFNETLRANILLARPDASEQKVCQAVERAALAEFVDALPDGLETRVGERGVRLSGGQRQRVAIARAFLKDAPILILDEATSHLDAVNEQAVRYALEELMADRTTVVIAHRLSTIRNADKIFVLDAGHVVESGGHEELLARRGLYSQLVGRQLASVAAE
ncbi:MAG: thiol reductant ABC exporter subunit CydD [Gammaproteobacteria bacterium]|nr:MAG: thiol reductant ABC exporter subunit CydD [Gammaproteobacteria bacterium]